MSTQNIRIFDVLRVAFGNLSGSKLRSFLTIMGIAVGIGAVVFLVSLGFGLQELTIHKITSSSAITTIDVSQSNSTILKLDKEMLARFSNIADVSLVSPISSQPGQATFGTTTTDIIALGVDDKYVKLEQPKFVAGTTPSSADEIIVSSAIAKLFAIDNPLDMLGKKINLTLFISSNADKTNLDKKDISGTVAGVIENTSSIIYLDISKIQQFGINDYSQVKVKVATVDKVASVKEKIMELGFQVGSVSDVIAEINGAFRVIQYVLAGFGIIALLVASIGMFNTMTIALLERTKDIGVMKALGARNRDIRRIFIAEAIIIALFGGLLGIALAVGLGTVINFGINILVKASQEDGLALFNYPPIFLTGILTLTVIIGFITGLYPARRASKLNPLNALRYE